MRVAFYDLLTLAFEGASGGEDFPDELERRVCTQRTCLVPRRHRHGCRTSSPDQDGSPLIDSHLLGLDELGLEIFEVVIVQVERSTGSQRRETNSETRGL
jgi:hypothetical protein